MISDSHRVAEWPRVRAVLDLALRPAPKGTTGYISSKDGRLKYQTAPTTQAIGREEGHRKIWKKETNLSVRTRIRTWVVAELRNHNTTI